MKQKTAKKTNPTQQAQFIHKLSQKKVWVPLLVFVLFLQTVGITVIGLYTVFIAAYTFNGSLLPPSGFEQYLRSSSGYTFKDIMKTGAEGLYSPMVASVEKNSVTIPEARLQLPFNNTSKRFLYAYNEATNDGTETWPAFITINTQYNINRIMQIESLDDLPCAQRLALITIDKEGPINYNDMKLESSKLLADGRTVYIHSVQHSGCSPIGSPEHTDEYLDVLKQVESF